MKPSLDSDGERTAVDTPTDDQPPKRLSEPERKGGDDDTSYSDQDDGPASPFASIKGIRRKFLLRTPRDRDRGRTRIVDPRRGRSCIA